MGETEKATQGNPQNTEQTSGSKEGSTSEQTPKTYTEQEHEKIVSDRLASAGRDAKSLETREKALNAEKEKVAEQSAKIEQWQREQDEKLKSTDPDRYNVVQEQRKLEAMKADLDKKVADFEADKATHTERLKAADETEREITIWRIAEKHGVDSMKLKEKSTTLNLQSEEQIDELAQTMAGAKEPKMPLKPDSSVTTGGGEDLSTMSSRKAFGSHLEDKKKQ